MEIKKILEKATLLINEGKEKLPTEIKSDTFAIGYFPDPEYYIQYSEAFKWLLTYFNKNNHKPIQEFIDENIPRPPKYIENEIHFKNLFSSNKDLRIKTAKYFSKIARQERSGFLEFPFSYPKTFERLFPALNDKEPKVVRDIIITLGAAYNHHFKHYEVYERLSPFFYSKNSELRYYAIVWTRRIENKEKLDTLKSLLNQKQPKKIKEILTKYIQDKETELE